MNSMVIVISFPKAGWLYIMKIVFIVIFFWKQVGFRSNAVEVIVCMIFFKNVPKYQNNLTLK